MVNLTAKEVHELIKAKCREYNRLVKAIDEIRLEFKKMAHKEFEAAKGCQCTSKSPVGYCECSFEQRVKDNQLLGALEYEAYGKAQAVNESAIKDCDKLFNELKFFESCQHCSKGDIVLCVRGPHKGKEFRVRWQGLTKYGKQRWMVSLVDEADNEDAKIYWLRSSEIVGSIKNYGV